MSSCVLKTCKNQSTAKNKDCGVTYHRFPRPGHEKREAWIRFVQENRNEDSWLPSDHTLICSDHFKHEHKYFTKTGRLYLKKCAVPYAGSDSKSDISEFVEPIFKQHLHAPAPSEEGQSSISESCSSAQVSQLPSTIENEPREEYFIKIENQSDHDEGSDAGEEEFAETSLRPILLPVKRERDGSCGGADGSPERGRDDNFTGPEVPLVAVGDIRRNENSIGDVSTETAKELLERLRALTEGDSYDAFGRYVATTLRSMPATRAQDLQLRIVGLLVGGWGESAEGGRDDH